jgi:hypothetical protein
MIKKIFNLPLKYRMDLDKIFSELRKELKNYDNGLSNKKRELTPDFNAFEIVSLLELNLSRIIGEFLNPEGRHEHKQLFLNLFIDMFLQGPYFIKKNIKC